MGGGERQSSSPDEFPSYEQTVAKATSLEDHCLAALPVRPLGSPEGDWSAPDRNLDDDGYLRIPLSEIVNGMDFSEAETESILKEFKPLTNGVGAVIFPNVSCCSSDIWGKAP